MKNKNYSELLKDPRWQKKRLEIMQRDNFACALCLDTKSTLHVHHKKYIKGNMPWAYEDKYLITLCDKCHQKQHLTDEFLPTTTNKDDIDLARDILFKALVNAEINSKYKDEVIFEPLFWRHNYGVFKLLPFHLDDDPYYFEMSLGLKDDLSRAKETNCLNWFDQNTDRGHVSFTPDITIFHKGTPKYFIYISNKTIWFSFTDFVLIKGFFKGYCIPTIVEVPAEAILSIQDPILSIPKYTLIYDN